MPIISEESSMSAQPLAFISYRRSDAAQAAQSLHIQLRERFGPSRVFMDVGAIEVGDVWPDRLRRAIEKATVLIVVVGPGWLTAADRYGRRRLDQPTDWVRNEIVSAIESKKRIVTLRVGNADELQPEGLPSELRPLLNSQGLCLRDERWDDDVDEVVKTLVSNCRFVANDKRVALPQPEVRIAPLSDAALDAELLTLPDWESVEDVIPGDYPNSRQELRRAYRFRSFKSAINFMHAAIEPVQKVQHHPRWENQWRTVTVYLTTWDVGNKVTQIDVDLARLLDALYKKMSVRPATHAPMSDADSDPQAAG
jgi:pterin-4a-carbinolamine dehydratase